MTHSTFIARAAGWAAVVGSGLLLAAAFPPVEWRYSAWVAFVPLLLYCRRLNFRQAALASWAAGWIAWLVSLFFLTRVTWGGWILLTAYCALYWIPLGLMASWHGRTAAVRPVQQVVVMLLGALGWSGCEYLRSVLFTGFGWNTLAISQFDNLAVIQVADLGGVYLVSFVIMAMNLGLALTLVRYMENRTGPPAQSRLVHVELLTAILLVALSVSYGITRIKQRPPVKPLRVALIQTNIPQHEKWTIQFIDYIFNTLEKYTRLVADPAMADLIVWPETAVPDYVRSSRESYDLVYQLATNGVPILVGSMDTRPGDDGEDKFYNSSFLFGPDGHIMELYDKRHLVMFGEYVPLEKWVPFFKALTPIEASFDAGERPTVFSLGDKADFATLICFEDVLPELSREVVRLGARMLINQTNDAWFDPLSGSRQHMMHCVFRCIENRVPAVRSANTGMTCAINRFGMVYEVLRGEKDRDYRVAGFKLTEVHIPEEPFALTFYTRHGDVFGKFAAVVAVGLLVGMGAGAFRGSTRRIGSGEKD